MIGSLNKWVGRVHRCWVDMNNSFIVIFIEILLVPCKKFSAKRAILLSLNPSKQLFPINLLTMNKLSIWKAIDQTIENQSNSLFLLLALWKPLSNILNRTNWTKTD